MDFNRLAGVGFLRPLDGLPDDNDDRQAVQWDGPAESGQCGDRQVPKGTQSRKIEAGLWGVGLSIKLDMKWRPEPTIGHI